MSRPGIEYQPALDGVRAVAVLAVLLFHGQVAGFGGGYLGVSVFFTLSGFLITSLMLVEHEATGRVRVGAFYVRRAKRLLPASLLCLTAIAVVAATTSWFDAVDTLRGDVLGALFQVANWVFLAGGDSYQDLFARAAGQASPVEHYWSLAIEEQFYWLWPLAFVAVTRLGRSQRARTAMVAAFTAGGAVLAPVVAAVWGGDAAYWATPARAAEILLGVLVAFVARRRTLARVWSAVAVVAFATLAVAVATFPAAGGPAYGGGLPLVGVASALLITGLQVDGPLRTALSARPLAGLGRISYGVYLFHWPVYVVVDAPRIELAGGTLLALRLAVTLVMAIVSYLAIERPIREGIRLPARRVGVAAGALTAAVAVASVVLIPAGRGSYWRDGDVTAAADAVAIVAAGDPGALVAPAGGRPDPASPAGATAAGDPASTSGVTPASSVAPTTASPLAAASTTAAPLPALARPVRILVAGDSTAEATAAGLVQWASEQPALAQVSVSTEPGCGFVRGGERMVLEWEPVPRRCGQWLDTTLPSTVAELRPDVVMLMTTSWDVIDRRWAGEALTPLDDEYASRLAGDFDDVSQRIVAAGAGHVVWVLEPIPNVYWWSSGQAQEDPARHAAAYAAMRAAAAADERVSVVDLPAWLDAVSLSADRDARPDGVHWSPPAAARIARDFLGEQLVRAALSTT
jgi:peptidoglycan/LPS O-acetylase OafA/YrhL